MVTKLDGQFTPGGRLVMGSLTQMADKDFDGKPIPEDNRRYFFGIAVPKGAPGVSELINALWTMAATDYAQVPLVMAQINQGLAATDFAWKIQDGDVATYDKKTGKLRDIPDYMKDCYIFKFSTQFEFGACDVHGVELNRADIKKGDYVDVNFNSLINGKMDDTAGIYLNPVAIRRLGYGDPIATGITATQAFAQHNAAVPAGATSMPTAAGAVPPAAGMPGTPTAQQTTASPSEPHTAILNGPPGGGMPGM